MVGFGFMDNIIMIQAGDLIDQHLGVTLGISTLTAAALGNVCSDSSGVLVRPCPSASRRAPAARHARSDTPSPRVPGSLAAWSSRGLSV